MALRVTGYNNSSPVKKPALLRTRGGRNNDAALNSYSQVSGSCNRSANYWHMPPERMLLVAAVCITSAILAKALLLLIGDPYSGPTLLVTSESPSQTNEQEPRLHDISVQAAQQELAASGQLIEIPKDLSRPTATIAYAISLVKCGDFQTTSAGLVDAALVMRHSIHLQSSRNPLSGSRYDYKMYAIVHSQAVACSHVLKSAGFTIVTKDPPIQPNEIVGSDHLRKHIHKEWCCGHHEFIKLYAFDLPGEEPIVVHVDIDFSFYQPMDHLFDAILFAKESSEGRRARSEIPLEQPNKPLPDVIEAFITRDYPQLLPTRIPGYQAGRYLYWLFYVLCKS
jgi:hypothetical protein